MVAILEFMRYSFVLLFGIALSICFAGIPRTRRNVVSTMALLVFSFLLQALILLLFGVRSVVRAYPFVVHLPLIIVLTTWFKRPLSISTVSVFSAYLCCQIPNWILLVSNAIAGSKTVGYIFYLPSVLIIFYLLVRFVVGPVSRLMEQSVRICLLFGAVPFFYYLFDYATTIYTDLLYSGTIVAVQFMPTVVAMFYFLFILLYYSETKNRETTQRDNDNMAALLRKAEVEFSSLRSMQEQAVNYRHDLRHHLVLISRFLEQGEIQKAKDYLGQIQAEVASITPSRFCENETVNLVLSSFSGRAEKYGIVLSIKADLPQKLNIPDTELCSVLSNGLENALNAVEKVLDFSLRKVYIECRVDRNQFLLMIENPYQGELVMDNGVPISNCEGHGFGCRSMLSIAEKRNGFCTFKAATGIFTLRMILPM